MKHEQHHYDITGHEVTVQEPVEEDKINNREFVTVVLVSLVIIGICGLVVYNICR